TVNGDGVLRSRPMCAQFAEAEGVVWLITDVFSPKVREIAKDARVSVSFASPSDERYASISGTAELVRDRAKVERLWDPACKPWFPKGRNSPDLAALKVTIKKAEYWDATSSRMVKLFGFAKALATGKRYTSVRNKAVEFGGASRVHS